MGKGDLGKAAACEWTVTNKQKGQSKRLDWAFAAHHALLMTGHTSVDVPIKRPVTPLLPFTRCSTTVEQPCTFTIKERYNNAAVTNIYTATNAKYSVDNRLQFQF